MPTPIDLLKWLDTHANVKKNIKWNYKFDTSAYHVPESAKLVFDKWSAQQKQDLVTEYTALYTLFNAKKPLVDNIVYPPKNISSTAVNDTGSAHVHVSQDYAWKMYIKWIAFNLYADIYSLVPWGLGNYNDAMLQMFFDSACMSACGAGNEYTMGAASPGSPNYIAPPDNLGSSLIAPPLYTYDFLLKNKMIGKYPNETVVNVLKWVSANLSHFYGSMTYKRGEEVWQYRGLPPIPSIIAGTKDAGNKNELAHWTAGCHGTAGFIVNILRAANVPVQILIVCGHALVYFMFDGMFLDHADDLYNSAFKATGQPVNHLFINEATYKKWFGNTHNNHDGTFPGCDCAKVGHKAVDITAS